MIPMQERLVTAGAKQSAGRLPKSFYASLRVSDSPVRQRMGNRYLVPHRWE
jgi:hypothetical protein